MPCCLAPQAVEQLAFADKILLNKVGVPTSMRAVRARCSGTCNSALADAQGRLRCRVAALGNACLTAHELRQDAPDMCVAV